MKATEFKFLRALLNMGSLKDISKATGVSLSKINKVLNDDAAFFNMEEQHRISILFRKSFEHSMTSTGHMSNDLKVFYPILISLRLDKYGSGYKYDTWGNDKELIKTAFLHTLDRYEKAKWLKKSYIDTLRELLDAFLES